MKVFFKRLHEKCPLYPHRKLSTLLKIKNDEGKAKQFFEATF